MADIKTLIDRKTGKIIYPQTIARAIYDSYGKNLQTRLDELNQDYVATSVQSLTDEKKTQARWNINAAPGGFGWGGNASRILAGADLNSYVKTGRYAQGTTQVMKQILNLPDAFSNGGIVVDVLAISPTYVAQIAYNLRDNKDIITAMRQNYVGAWQPWEYVNPPMALGIEYRTTERYMGKPLYKKLIEFPSLTGRDYQNVYGRDGFVISAIGEVRSPQNTKFWMPIVINPVAGQANSPFPTIAFANFYSADVGVVCASTSEYIGQPARVLVTYYKITD